MIIFEFMKFENIDKLKQLIDNSNNIVIIPHTNPDGDAVGSCLALHCIFKKLKKTSIVLSPNTCLISLEKPCAPPTTKTILLFVLNLFERKSRRPQIGAKGLVYVRCNDDGSFKSSRC
jgi:hypothetical protein